MDEENEGGFKVKDKRRFDDAGNLKGEASEERAVPEQVAPQPSGQDSTEGDFVMKDSEGVDSDGTPIDYTSFILSLATQAMVQLGEMPSPPGVEIPKNPEAAKHTIDVIEMLEVKTKGNLNAAEIKLTEEILHSLRISYVRNKG